MTPVKPIVLKEEYGPNTLPNPQSNVTITIVVCLCASSQSMFQEEPCQFSLKEMSTL